MTCEHERIGGFWWHDEEDGGYSGVCLDCGGDVFIPEDDPRAPKPGDENWANP